MGWVMGQARSKTLSPDQNPHFSQSTLEMGHPRCCEKLSSRAAPQVAQAEGSGRGQPNPDLFWTESSLWLQIGWERIARGRWLNNSFGENPHLCPRDQRDFHGDFAHQSQQVVKPERSGKHPHAAAKHLRHATRRVAEIEFLSPGDCDRLIHEATVDHGCK